MSRLEQVLRDARGRGRKLLVPYFTGGYPDRDTNIRLLLDAQEMGADALELGIPFSDPSADGPVIQRASAEALRAGTTVRSLLQDVSKARESGLTVPVLLMTYYNPILAYGVEGFAADAQAAGVDGVLIVDLPLEEADEFIPVANGAGLATVLLVAPTSPAERVRNIVQRAGGFVYCVSVTGVTGEKAPLLKTVGKLVERVRAYSDLPAIVGFGVSSPETARDIARISDGVVVGSALIRSFEGTHGVEAVGRSGAFLRSLRQALDALSGP